MTLFRLLAVGVIISLAGVGGCGFQSRKAQIKLRFDGPSFPAGFKCAGLLLTGESIPTQDNNIRADWESVYNGTTTCPYPGLSTVAQAITTDKPIEFSLYVPGGRKTTVQVLGIETTGACPTQTLNELILAKKAGTLASEIKGIYELGRQPIENLKSAVITVTKTYDAAKATNLLTCFEKPADPPSGGGLFPYTAMKMFAGDRYVFKPTGGTPPYTFTPVSGIGGLVSSIAEAVFSATTVNSFAFRIADSTTLSQTVTIEVVGITLPRFWYSARYFFSGLDEQALVASTPWVNSGSVSNEDLSLGVLMGSTGTAKRLGGPRGFPSVVIPTGGSFGRLTNNFISGSHSVLMVARRLNDQALTLYCMGYSACSGGSLLSMLEFPATPTEARFTVADGAGGASALATPDTPQEGWSLFEGHFTVGSGNTLTLKFQGKNAVNSHNVAAFSNTTGNLTFGGANGTGAEVDMEIAEVMVMQGDTTGTLATDLREKYGLP